MACISFFYMGLIARESSDVFRSFSQRTSQSRLCEKSLRVATVYRLSIEPCKLTLLTGQRQRNSPATSRCWYATSAAPGSASQLIFADSRDQRNSSAPSRMRGLARGQNFLRQCRRRAIQPAAFYRRPNASLSGGRGKWDRVAQVYVPCQV